MKHDVIYGDLEDMVLDDIYETYPNIESEDWCGRIDMFWEDRLDDTGSSRRCDLEGRGNPETELSILRWVQDIHDH